MKQYGPAPGARILMDRERDAAEWSLRTGIYGVWRCPSVLSKQKYSSSDPDVHFLDFCSRIGPACLCACGHHFSDHDQKPTLPRRASTKCHLCDCNEFYFVPSRPEGFPLLLFSLCFYYLKRLAIIIFPEGKILILPNGE